MKATASLNWLLGALLVAGCGDGGPPAIDFCSGGAEVIFDPADGQLLPFPANLYLGRDPATATGYRLRLDTTDDEFLAAFDFMPEQLDRLDGFGTTAALAFGISRQIGTVSGDPQAPQVEPPPSLQLEPGQTTGPASPVLLVDIDPDSPDFGEALPLLLDYVSDPLAPGRGRHLLLAEPAFPLRPGTTYAAALTTRLRDADGACLAPSAATRRLLSGRAGEELGLLAEQAPAALEVLSDRGFITGPGELSALTVFTTQSIGPQLLAARDRVLEHFAGPGPWLVEGSIEVEPQPDDDAIAAVVRGRFLAPNFRSAAGTFVLDEQGRPQVQGQQELEFELLLPRPSAEHPGPFPVIIYQHGLMGWKEQDRGAKRAQAAAGFASLAIDAVLHGTRKASSGWEVTNFFGIDLDPGPGEKAFDMELLRDNFRQAYLDLVSLSELVPALAGLDLLPAGAPDGRPELTAAPLYLSGHSLGGIIAAGAAALAPRIEAVNISAGGGSLPTNLFMRSEIFGSFIDLLAPEGTSPVEVRRFMPVLQVLTERGDPANLAGLVIAAATQPRPVLQQEVMDDAFVPNTSNEALARALGLAHLEPVLRPVFGLEPRAEPAAGNHGRGVTAVLFQFDRLSDGSAAEHTEIYADALAQQQWIHFFTTFLEQGQAEAADPYRLLGIERP